MEDTYGKIFGEGYGLKYYGGTLPFLFFIQHRTDSLFLLGTAIFICWKTPCPPRGWRRTVQMIL